MRNIAAQNYTTYDPANPSTAGTVSNLVASDRVILGNSNPTYYGGLGNTFTYKNLDFNAFFVFSGAVSYTHLTLPTT